jgi:hypothetical protein
MNEQLYKILSADGRACHSSCAHPGSGLAGRTTPITRSLSTWTGFVALATVGGTAVSIDRRQRGLRLCREPLVFSETLF